MKGLLSVFTLIVTISAGYCQSTKSVVRLNNGVLIKGEIVEFVQDEYMIMKVMEGYDMRIPSENIRSFKIKKGKLAAYNPPGNGYFNYTSLGLLFLKANRYDAVDVNMSIHTVNGMRFLDIYKAGLGVGLDRYGTLSALPVYLSVSRDLKQSRVTPIFGASVGYSKMWESETFNEWKDYQNVKGGIFWQLGAGLRINYNKTALIFNYAYKRQNSRLTSVNEIWWWGNSDQSISENHKFRNMTLTVGMEF
jgi:hypothetical protein